MSPSKPSKYLSINPNLKLFQVIDVFIYAVAGKTRVPTKPADSKLQTNITLMKFGIDYSWISKMQHTRQEQ
jgi:hypothetical protein